MEPERMLNKIEMDAIGEIGNISMGTSATTLSKLLNKVVRITTPRVMIKTLTQLHDEYPKPNIALQIEYIHGLIGKNLLIIKDEDVKIITDLLMGGTGEFLKGEINEMHLSAVCEVMNQMIGSSSTALSEMFEIRIDISPPVLHKTDFTDNIFNNDLLVIVLFEMEIEDINKTDIMLIMPVDFAKSLIEASMKKNQEKLKEPGYKDRGEQKVNTKKPVNVSRIQFEELGGDNDGKNQPRPLDILMNVPLELKVELGKTLKTVKDVLSFDLGSIIELQRQAGDDVDIVLNGRYIAKGEVVVVDDSYGVRITEILE